MVPRSPDFSMAGLARFVALFAALYAAFGVQSPYLPALLQAGGLPPGEIGLVLGAATAVKLAAGPAAGRLADLLAARKAVFAACAAAASLLALGYLGAEGIALLLLVAVLQSVMLASLAPLADTF